MTSLLLTLALAAPETITLKVGDIERKAVVYRGTTKSSAPLVFVFHGFTGNAVHAAGAYGMHREWPEATVIYPQGLEVNLLNRKGPGWQIAPRLQQDRDLKFFDALLDKAKKDFGIDSKKVYTCGMSNGAIFSYVLVSQRKGTFAAAGPVAGFAPPAFRGSEPTPMMIIHGKGDELLGISLAEGSRDAAVSNNKASKTTKDWSPGYTLYPGEKGKDVIWHQHDGGHIWPKDATANLVKFFKQR